MTEETLRRFTVRDHDRELSFRGVRLGRASSRARGKRRWTEIEIYLTEAGSFIVAGVGRSVVKRGERYWDDRAGAEVVAKEDEAPYYWAAVCDTAGGAVQSLYQIDGDGVRYLTRVARDAIRLAAKHNDELRRAFTLEDVA